MYYDEAFELSKDVSAAVLLMKIAYYSSIAKKDRLGWFYKTTQEFIKETGLSRRAFQKAKEKLLLLNFIEYKVCGLPARSWYRVTEQLNQLRQVRHQSQKKQSFQKIDKDEAWLNEAVKYLR
jgi:hypothetical protein